MNMGNSINNAMNNNFLNNLFTSTSNTAVSKTSNNNDNNNDKTAVVTNSNTNNNSMTIANSVSDTISKLRMDSLVQWQNARKNKEMELTALGRVLIWLMVPVAAEVLKYGKTNVADPRV